MGNAFQIRPITFVPFKELGQIQTLHIEQLIITGVKNIDIGAWCYRKRSRTFNRRKGKTVDLSTFDTTRPAKLKPVIECLFDELSHTSAATQGDHLHNLMYLLNWCDENGYSDVLIDEPSSRNSYKAYCDALRDRCGRGKLKSRTAAKYQTQLLRIFQALYSNSLFGDGVRVIKAKAVKFDTTQSQNESDQANILAWCQAIFDGFTDFVLADEAFPFQLAIPTHKNWTIDCLWVFPSTTMIMTPDSLAKRETMKRGNWVYDYSSGKINTKAFLKDYYKDCRNAGDGAETAIRTANKSLSLANADHRHLQRKRLAQTASLAFLHMLYAYSGQNATPVQSMRWQEGYVVGAERQGFRVIKNRGHKGQILFELENTFLPTFRKYLKLRKWLLKDTVETNLLFFTQGKNFDSSPKEWNSPTATFRSTLKTIGIELPAFGARQFRANKNEYANEHADLATAAKAANHSVDTHIKNYMSGTQNKHAKELSSFFATLVKSATEGQTSENQIGLGHCENPGDPTTLTMYTSIPPKCGQPEGCLFCKHFFVHADEVDIRKLASGRYVIQRTRHLADSPEQFEALFNPVFEKIAGLLNEISNRSEKLERVVKRVVREVTEEEDLSDFWASELRYLIDLELVNG